MLLTAGRVDRRWPRHTRRHGLPADSSLTGSATCCGCCRCLSATCLATPHSGNAIRLSSAALHWRIPPVT